MSRRSGSPCSRPWCWCCRPVVLPPETTLRSSFDVWSSMAAPWSRIRDSCHGCPRKGLGGEVVLASKPWTGTTWLMSQAPGNGQDDRLCLSVHRVDLTLDSPAPTKTLGRFCALPGGSRSSSGPLYSCQSVSTWADRSRMRACRCTRARRTLTNPLHFAQTKPAACT